MQKLDYPFALKPENLVNIAIIDAQHQNFVLILNNLYYCFQNQGSEAEVKSILDALTIHAALHFQTEEALLEKYQYPALDEQKLQHHNLTSVLLNKLKTFNYSEPSSTMDILDFMEDWLVSHLSHYDIKYSQFLNDKGVF